ncbi:alpha-xenorhabdolysin family binary toxin subunit A [Pseudomonas sp. SZMC_28357]|uniref:alpha-xenorhabdolysin family binary toxin subunit A n=1 Tax=Pseudomonas sp. SZMC_28357 TaxID=3074380 RepID=UPI00287229E4|nr:alpha-xenorhabdolysin family binary toxin subunit A [Pseudomonas sp. SZMC_28357]MDR9750169.1 alpha-xenorhabdolysin family binary toxin subunit A [Pseudomonas sp. SZMC_28357]
MTSHDLWDDALRGATPEQLNDFAAQVPKLLTGVSVAGDDNVIRDTGLLLTKKQVIDLRKYEAAGLALPYTLKDVIDYLRFGAGQDGGAGLRPEDFLTTFQNTRNHARRWSPLREKIMMTGSDLKTFARSMLNYGEGMEEVAAEVKASGLLERYNIKTMEQLRELELELGDKFPGIELEEDTLSNLGYYLDRIFEKIETNLEIVTAIKKELDTFGYDLREHVLPGIKLRVGMIDGSTLSADIKRIKEIIDQRALEIDIKNTEYKAAVQEALKAAAGMNIVGLAMAIYMGVEAENIRAQRNRLYAEQEQDIQTLNAMNQTLGSLARVKHDLQSLMIVSIDADVATQNLMHVWNSLFLSVRTSFQSISRINNALGLAIFMRQFREIVAPWGDIEKNSDKLLQVFKDADEEYDRNYTSSTRPMNVTPINIRSRTVTMRNMAIGVQAGAAYPSIDKALLASSNQQMRDDRTDAGVWCTKLNYLPHLYDRFNRLVLNVGTAGMKLQEAAQDNQYTLDLNIGRLARLEADLRDELNGDNDLELITELERERTQLLDDAVQSVREPGNTVRDCLKDISDAFDQRLTRAYLVDFEREAREAAAEIDVLRAKLVAVQDERKVVIDAVKAIEKSGLDELGKGIVLTIEKLKELGLAPPEIQLVMFAIEQLKKTTEDIGNGIRFLDMVRESDKLQEKIEALSRQIDLESSIISTSTGKAKYIHAIHAIEEQRHVYASEYAKAATAFEHFVRAMDAEQFADSAARSLGFTQQARQFLEFLGPVARP